MWELNIKTCYNIPMFRPLALCLGIRYNLSRKRTGFVSFLSIASMVGIILGVAILITVLSVMNGFDYEIKQRFFSVAPQVTVTTHQTTPLNWSQLGQWVTQNPNVNNYAPYMNGKGMLSFKGDVAAVELVGIVPAQEQKISQIAHKMVAGSLSSLVPGHYNIILGRQLALNLGVLVGDQVVVLTPQATTTPLGILPRYRQFTVSGVFHAGTGFGIDDSVAFIHYQDAQKLFSGGAIFQGVHVTVKNIYQAPDVADQLQNSLPPGYFVSSWSDQFGAFFHALAMEKTMMFFILLLIIAVAAFNLVSGLVMVVNDKQADIAILRTLGARRSTIMLSFVIQGALIGFVGIVLGIGLGLVLSINATAIVNEIQNIFHVQFIQSSVYFVDYLPSRLEGQDVILVGGITFLLTLIATIYPAWRAFQTMPAEALRYDG